MQVSGSLASVLPDSGTAFAELDLALIDALQADPRAPWTRVGAALGVDATTAARHWARLVERGLAWITAYPAPGLAAVAYVEVRCKAGAVDRLIEQLSELSWVFSIEHVVGDFDLLLSVCAADLPALGRQLNQLGVLKGVRSSRTLLSLRHYREGSRWQVRALPARHRSALLDAQPALPRVADEKGAGRGYDRTDLALVLALSADGRAGFPELAAHAGLSESTARRRLNRLVRDHGLLLRCDLAQPLAGWPVVVTYRSVVPHQDLERIGLTLAQLPQTRLCASVTGSCNLLLSVWLRGTREVGAFDALLAERMPELRVQSRTVTLRSAKRMGRILDGRGRAVRNVPANLPPASQD
ncbi:Lrp/AsnC family transcriptional regulator [Streptomyces sp. NPDC051129]|uniref:Lrp/AsnC family transcriptional regulator n=1 Tax=Streptomyces sp. NPDC051129 TaxID=3154639 RepID=UPI003413341A